MRTNLPRIVRRVAFIALLLVACALALGASAAAQGQDAVLVTRVDDAITPIIADHLEDAVERAEDGGYQALVVEIDTPGGLDSSMRDIIQRFLGADVPVVVYVSPSGARAASAGALITLAAHVAAMAPGTNIGAATPVSLADGEEVGDKVVNDAAAYAAAIAEERGRDIDFAVDAVRDGRSEPASDAAEIGAVDLVVDSRRELLDAIDGMQIELDSGRTVTLHTAGAAVDEYDMTTLRQILQWLADPNLAFLFLSIGTLGIIFELVSPGIGAGGIVGGAMIILALFSLSVLPVDATGFVFLFLALALFAAELFAPGIGVFAVSGAVSLALSGVFLFREDAPGLELSLAAVLPTVIVMAVLVVIAGRLVWRVRRAPPRASGADALMGRELIVAVAGEGTRARGQVDGTWWRLRARAGTAPLAEGDRVRVVSVSGLELVVDPATADVTPGEEPL